MSDITSLKEYRALQRQRQRHDYIFRDRTTGMELRVPEKTLKAVASGALPPEEIPHWDLLGPVIVEQWMEAADEGMWKYEGD